MDTTRAFVFLKLRRRSFAVAIAVASVACGDREPPKREPVAQAPARDTSVVGGEVALGDTTTNQADAIWITDANALAMLNVMNARQIATADVELGAWHSDTVRALAASVARDHAELQHSADSVATRLKLAPLMSALGQKIDSEFQSRIDTLRYWTGNGLEHAYVRQQAASEQAMADYANQLTGAAHAPEVQALMQLASTRAAAAASRIRSIQAEIAIADSTKAAAVADSVARVEARRAAREAARSKRQREPPAQ